jgi:hypothetical protein
VRVGGLKEVLTYWAPEPENQFGVKTHAEPIVLKGHWSDRSEQFNTVGGQVITSKAVAMVDRDLLVDGFLAFGDYTTEPEPTVVPLAFPIQAFLTEADLRSVSKVRKAVM